MNYQKQKLFEERLQKFCGRVHKVLKELPKDKIGANICYQASKSVTSTCANYNEACNSESIQDFLHKCQISRKESKETYFWLITIAQTYPELTGRMSLIIKESDEIVRIFSKTAITTRKKIREG